MFSNNQLDTQDLPKFEQIDFKKIDNSYLQVILLNLLVLAVVLISINIFFYLKVENFEQYSMLLLFGSLGLFILVSFFSIVGFYKKGYAFREHDVVYRSGVIATTIMVIPYNRVQHVALHEGPTARIFGFTRVRIYTAGSGSGDLGIDGIPKAEAQDIKQLLMNKIQKTLD